MTAMSLAILARCARLSCQNSSALNSFHASKFRILHCPLIGRSGCDLTPQFFCISAVTHSFQMQFPFALVTPARGASHFSFSSSTSYGATLAGPLPDWRAAHEGTVLKV